MRKLVAYSLEAKHAEQPGRFTHKSVTAAMEKWLQSKGKFSADGSSISLPDNEVATLERTGAGTEEANLSEVVLTQPKGDGWFRTAISLCEGVESTAVSVSLSAASATLAPLMLDVRCPRLVHELLKLPAVWRLGNTPVHLKPRKLSGVAGAGVLADLIWRAGRSVPVIAVSEYRGEALYPRISELLAADLAGLAVVVQLSEDTSWAITQEKGKSWSCYQGAIRIYWPRISAQSSPSDHPLWTLQRILGAGSDAASASERLRTQLRRRILSQSAFAVAEPELILKTRREVRTRALATLSAKAAQSEDLKIAIERQAAEIEGLTKELEARESEIATLKEQVSNLQLALQWKHSSPDDIEPEQETPPSSVEDAVLTAVLRFKDTLLFGSDAFEGIAGLDPDAGPPDKILNYLKALSDLTEQRRRGSLGKTALKWLQDRGVNASGESETTANTKSERAKRSWDDGLGGKRYFEDHLKPADGTAPSRCVRIYFLYDEVQQKTIVGWVGRHLK